MMKQIQIPREADQHYRAFLLKRCPPSVLVRLKDGLTNGPKPRGGAHAIRYFGADEVKAIGMRCAPLLDRLEVECPLIQKWFVMTGFANDYRILKAFDEWAALEKTPAIIIPGGAAIIHG